MTHTRNCIHSCCLPCNYMSIWGNVLTRQTAHGNFLIICQMVSHPNINFLLSKQNVEAIGCIVNLRHVLSFTQTNRALQSNINKQINKYLYCNELHLFSSLFLFWFQSNTEQVFLFVMYLVPITIYKFKRRSELHLNSH